MEQVEELPGAVVWPEECGDLCPEGPKIKTESQVPLLRLVVTLQSQDSCCPLLSPVAGAL